MSTMTEAPFSLTIKVGPNNDLLTGRAETVEEMQVRIAEILSLQASMHGVATPATAEILNPPPAWAGPQAVAGHAEAVATVQQQLGGQVIATPISVQTDRWGNTFTQGQPVGSPCIHGPRIHAVKKSKAGKDYTAFVCVNDSPFGDYKLGKCPQEYPER